MTVKKNLAGIAKKSGTAVANKLVARKPAPKKPVAKKEPVLSPEEIRDQKAKARVDELLQGVDLSLEKKDELLELDETPEAGDSQSVEWLQEQVGLQAQQIETLRRELGEARVNNPAPVDDGTKATVLTLFNELQENYQRMGPNFRVFFPAFLNRMVKFFPFLAQHKKYQ
jgi:hypothetical protein